MAQLSSKLERVLAAQKWNAVAIGGGVAANGPLRAEVEAICARHDLRLKLVPPALCTDNAAMIAAAASHTQALPYPDYLEFDAVATRLAAA